jgi:predicted XRE-type DNA-binding protein
MQEKEALLLPSPLMVSVEATEKFQPKSSDSFQPKSSDLMQAQISSLSQVALVEFSQPESCDLVQIRVPSLSHVALVEKKTQVSSLSQVTLVEKLALTGRPSSLRNPRELRGDESRDGNCGGSPQQESLSITGRRA